MSDFCQTCGKYDCECLRIVARAVVVLAELAMSPSPFQMWVQKAGEELLRVAYPATGERPVVTEFKEAKSLSKETGASMADCRRALELCPNSRANATVLLADIEKAWKRWS